MSNVLARFRGEGESEILKDTRIARGHIITWLHNEKNLPSKYRMAMIPPIATDFREMVMEIRAAERDFPRTPELLAARKEDIRRALAAERALWDDLQAVYDMRRDMALSLADTCVCCGAPVPEGRMVCPVCEEV